MVAQLCKLKTNYTLGTGAHIISKCVGFLKRLQQLKGYSPEGLSLTNLQFP